MSIDLNVIREHRISDSFRGKFQLAFRLRELNRNFEWTFLVALAVALSETMR